MLNHLDILPVIQTGATQGGFAQSEPEGADEMEAGSGREAEASDIAGVLRDFRFNEGDVEAGFRPVEGQIGTAGMEGLGHAVCHKPDQPAGQVC